MAEEVKEKEGGAKSRFEKEIADCGAFLDSVGAPGGKSLVDRLKGLVKEARYNQFTPPDLGGRTQVVRGYEYARDWLVDADGSVRSKTEQLTAFVRKFHKFLFVVERPADATGPAKYSGIAQHEIWLEGRPVVGADTLRENIPAQRVFETGSMKWDEAKVTAFLNGYLGN